MQINQITKDEAQKMLDEGSAIMVDVREPEEFELYRIEGKNIVNIPLKGIADRIAYLKRYPNIICICRTSQRSMEAASLLTRSGLSEIYVVKEGVAGWLNIYYEK